MSGPDPGNRADSSRVARGARGSTPSAGGLPSQRPTWLVMLASLMAMVAFQNFGEALDHLTGKRAAPRTAVAGEAAPASPQQAVRNAVEQAHYQAVQDLPAAASRLVALLNLAYAGLMLLGVAAVATRDRRGRAAAMASALAGIAHHLAAAVVFLAIIRPAIWRRSSEWLGPLKAMTQPETGSEGLPLPGWVPEVAVMGPYLTAYALGIGFCAVVLVFFGGRRGKIYYGLTPVRPAGAARTGA